jgi:hypothetical protein
MKQSFRFIQTQFDAQTRTGVTSELDIRSAANGLDWLSGYTQFELRTDYQLP